MAYTLLPNGNPLSTVPFFPNAGLLGLARRGGLGFTQMAESAQEVQLAAMNLGYTYYIDPSTGVTMVSGVVAPNGQSVPLTGDQFLAFIG